MESTYDDGIGVVDDALADGVGQGRLAYLLVPSAHFKLGAEDGGSLLVAPLGNLQQIPGLTLLLTCPPVIVPNPMLGIPIWGRVSLAPHDCIVPLGGVAVKGGAAVQFTLDGQAAKRYPLSKRRKG